MSESKKRWVPDVAARLAVLRSELAKPGTDNVELPIAGVPTQCFVGAETGGNIWIRITCDPKSVSADDQAAAVKFTVTSTGYKVTVDPVVAGVVVEHLMDEMVQLLADGHPPGDAGRSALQNWRDLLARPAGTPLSEEALIGLFGELEVLETIVRLGGPFDSWTGWARDQCDFRLHGLVIEAKSTGSANYRRVRIHGLGQLADPEDGSDLILVLKRLEATPDGRSLPDIIESLVRLGTSRAVLLERLSRAHYSEQHRSRYEQFRYLSTEVALRRIDDSHPRLVPQMLATVDLSCIDKIDYELNLNGEADADLNCDLESLIAEHLDAK
ncbi:MAG: PD-(D/E)XK motif protein [Ilumatobacteraceae bacterium]